MIEKIIHIISPEPPYPVLHGGRFDLFYKLMAFYNAGIKIHLHCFSTTEAIAPELSNYCVSVNLYPRKKGTRALSLKTPYIVRSRRSKSLLANLLADNHPILFEGIHSTGVLHFHDFQDRILILRLHNVEHVYYRRLFDSTTHPFKKMYYLAESILLRRYEQWISSKFSKILAVSTTDADLYRKEFHVSDIEFVPVFVRFDEASTSLGNFCLYHGNLSIAENVAAVKFLVSAVFDGLDIPLYIAGRQPDAFLKNWLKKYSFVTVFEDPSNTQLDTLISSARINVIPSMNSTGVKLKLIHSVFSGGHCLTNQAGVAGSELERFCVVANDSKTLKQEIIQLYQTPMTTEQIEDRRILLKEIFDLDKNADRVSRMIW